jgi:hypothetical protein
MIWSLWNRIGLILGNLNNFNIPHIYNRLKAKIKPRRDLVLVGDSAESVSTEEIFSGAQPTNDRLEAYPRLVFGASSHP